MTWLAAKLLLGRVPGIVWAILIVVAILGASAVAILKHGERVGRDAIVRQAVHDSGIVQRARVDTAEVKSNRVVRVASKARTVADTGRARVKADLAPLDATRPALVAEITAQLNNDSTALAIQSSAIDTLLFERAQREKLDTLTQHELVFKPPGDGGGISFTHVAEVTGVVAIIATVVEVIHLLLRALHP